MSIGRPPDLSDEQRYRLWSTTPATSSTAAAPTTWSNGCPNPSPTSSAGSPRAHRHVDRRARAPRRPRRRPATFQAIRSGHDASPIGLRALRSRHCAMRTRERRLPMGRRIIVVPLISADGAPDGIVGRTARHPRPARPLRRGAGQSTNSRRARVRQPARPPAGHAPRARRRRASSSTSCTSTPIPRPAPTTACRTSRWSGPACSTINPGNVRDGDFDRTRRRSSRPGSHWSSTTTPTTRSCGGERRYYDLRVARAGDVLIYTWRDRPIAAAPNEVAEREDLYRLVTEDVTDAVVRFADDGTITWVSPSFERLTRSRPTAVVGRSGAHSSSPSDDRDARGRTCISARIRRGHG